MTLIHVSRLNKKEHEDRIELNPNFVELYFQYAKVHKEMMENERY